ncbi:DUF3545 family protein [Neptunicella marina]|uniref:DUF3545 family protein n=1 Tax=Neptunicella marina TaxID=2125989 RepID=A0A8J6J1D9_9ALTE|nr:DUF3545 family protein [Neptunicella marina]MBC3767807.1 DUF3545 family protein [Neptunicella marina]
MDNATLISMLDLETRDIKTKKKKRKWREIEAIQDQYRLRKELEEIDMMYELDELESI